MVENSNEVLIIVYAHGITSDYESYACQHNSNSQSIIQIILIDITVMVV
jgi:hypothetical protein